MLPIIDSIDVVPAVIAPGETAVVTITAHDPDARTGTLTGIVSDLAGPPQQASAVLTIQDLLTYALEDTNAVGFIITPRAGLPHIFDVTAP